MGHRGSHGVADEALVLAGAPGRELVTPAPPTRCKAAPRMCPAPTSRQRCPHFLRTLDCSKLPPGLPTSWPARATWPAPTKRPALRQPLVLRRPRNLLPTHGLRRLVATSRQILTRTNTRLDPWAQTISEMAWGPTVQHCVGKRRTVRSASGEGQDRPRADRSTPTCGTPAHILVCVRKGGSGLRSQHRDGRGRPECNCKGAPSINTVLTTPSRPRQKDVLGLGPSVNQPARADTSHQDYPTHPGWDVLISSMSELRVPTSWPLVANAPLLAPTQVNSPNLGVSAPPEGKPGKASPEWPILLAATCGLVKGAVAGGFAQGAPRTI